MTVGQARGASNSSPMRGNYNNQEQYDESPANISIIPTDIISDILSRLPVKTLVRFRCVSKLWSSLIRDPSFANLHSSRFISAHPITTFHLLISTYNKSTSERHFLSVCPHGGATTHLLTLPNSPYDPAESQHLNGLFLIRRQNDFFSSTHFVCIFNPSTREITPLPPNVLGANTTCFPDTHLLYNLGFDPSSNEHKVLHMRLVNPRSYQAKVEFEIFSPGNFSWKKVDAEFPFSVVTGEIWLYAFKKSVCVNGVIHWFVQAKNLIVAFNLSEERFSTMSIPIPSVSSEYVSSYLIQVNGLLALVCHNQNLEIWILEDYQNQLWTKETVIFPSLVAELGITSPLDSVQTGEIFLKPVMTSSESLCIPFYDMGKKSFNFVNISLYPDWLSSTEVEVQCVRGFVESMLSLKGRECLKFH